MSISSTISFPAYLAIVVAILTSTALPGVFVNASDIIVSNHYQCTRIGKDLLEKNANVEQIYVAISLCEGIVHPMESGLGGGFQGVLYDSKNNQRVARYLMSREYSPYARQFTHQPLLFGNSVGIPSVLAGYARLLGVTDCLVTSPKKLRSSGHHQSKYYSNSCVQRIKSGISVGFFDSLRHTVNSTRSARPANLTRSGVPYADIFESCIHLARYGFHVSPTFDAMYSYLPSLDRLIQYNRITGTAINLRLANFIEFLSKDPLRLLDPYVRWKNRQVPVYQDVRRVMLEDLQHFNSKLTTSDFLSYRAKLNPVLSVPFRYHNVTYKLMTMPSPAGGEAVAFFAKMIEKIMEMSGNQGIKHVLTNEKISMLFVLCSRFSYAIKPYFRQLKQTVKRDLILNQAPRIAHQLYLEVSRATNESQLIKLYGRREYRIPSTFGRKHLPQIRVSALYHRAELHNEDTDDDQFSEFIETMASLNASTLYEAIDSEENNDEDEFTGGVDDNPYGTTNVVVKRGKRVIVATSSINHSYGSGIGSTRLGIFYNNVLRDFTPNTWYQRWWLKNGTKRFSRFANRARPHSVPQSSMGCTLLVNPRTNNPVFGIGGAGGFKITGAIFNVLWNYFVQGYSLNRSVNRLRIITKINYKQNVTELWYELPAQIGKAVEEAKNTPKFNSARLNFTQNDLPHAIDFFYRYREPLNVKFIKEAGYSAITAFTTLRNTTIGAYDSRRGGRAYVRN